MKNDQQEKHLGFYRLDEILNTLIPVSEPTWYKGVREGRFPAPVKIGKGRASFYLKQDIHALLDRTNDEGACK